ncbi:hypothetical protein GGX14DRAFT_558735 [Mycena pura]|uniref:Uncharacterized protein n=1 Tax=Mycena pura TaxID=153505 RepID=A0AAD6VSZ5_9AGAR|nr:hypothetical protein GGX14DRAFT_558735 [Mycena pura]
MPAPLVSLPDTRPVGGAWADVWAHTPRRDAGRRAGMGEAPYSGLETGWRQARRVRLWRRCRRQLRNQSADDPHGRAHIAKNDSSLPTSRKTCAISRYRRPPLAAFALARCPLRATLRPRLTGPDDGFTAYTAQWSMVSSRYIYLGIGLRLFGIPAPPSSPPTSFFGQIWAHVSLTNCLGREDKLALVRRLTMHEAATSRSPVTREDCRQPGCSTLDARRPLSPHRAHGARCCSRTAALPLPGARHVSHSVFSSTTISSGIPNRPPVAAATHNRRARAAPPLRALPSPPWARETRPAAHRSPPATSAPDSRRSPPATRCLPLHITPCALTRFSCRLSPLLAGFPLPLHAARRLPPTVARCPSGRRSLPACYALSAPSRYPSPPPAPARSPLTLLSRANITQGPFLAAPLATHTPPAARRPPRCEQSPENLGPRSASASRKGRDDAVNGRQRTQMTPYIQRTGTLRGNARLLHFLNTDIDSRSPHTERRTPAAQSLRRPNCLPPPAAAASSSLSANTLRRRVRDIPAPPAPHAVNATPISKLLHGNQPILFGAQSGARRRRCRARRSTAADTPRAAHARHLSLAIRHPPLLHMSCRALLMRSTSAPAGRVHWWLVVPFPSWRLPHAPATGCLPPASRHLPLATRRPPFAAHAWLVATFRCALAAHQLPLAVRYPLHATRRRPIPPPARRLPLPGSVRGTAFACLGPLLISRDFFTPARFLLPTSRCPLLVARFHCPFLPPAPTVRSMLSRPRCLLPALGLIAHRWVAREDDLIAHWLYAARLPAGASIKILCEITLGVWKFVRAVIVE